MLLKGRIMKGLGVSLIALIMAACAGTGQAQALSETGRSNVTLAKGVTESTVYITDSGKQNIRAHILRIQKGANVSLKAGYKGYYTKNSTAASRATKASKWGAKNWKWDTVATHVNEYQSSKDKLGNVIAAVSGDFLGGAGWPNGKLIIESHVLSSANSPFFAVLKNGNVDIRMAGGATSDVAEAVGGLEVLLSNGKVALKSKETHDPKVREPRQAIGVTKNQEVVIVNVDGRTPVSSGATLYTLADIMKAQGCVDAINLDGGGSGAFMTRRSSDKAVKLRNTLGDGFVRNIASSIMVVKKSSGKEGTLKGSATVSMKNSKTALTKSGSKYTYKINGKGQTGLFMINGKNYYFKNGKGITKTIKLGNVKYTFKGGLMTKCSDKKAKTVMMGRCGAGSGNNNLLFAYHSGNKKLIVGLNPLVKKNGKMKNWKGIYTSLPWYSMRNGIKSVYIGNGVTTLGSGFMYTSPKRKIFDGSVAPIPKLSSIRLPNSLKSIETCALFHTVKLKSLVIPAKVKTIKIRALASTGAKTITFKGKKAIKFGTNAMKSTKAKRVYVKNTSSWRKFIKAKKFKKAGYKKAVKYR